MLAKICCVSLRKYCIHLFRFLMSVIHVLERELQVGLEIVLFRKGHKIVLQIFLTTNNWKLWLNRGLMGMDSGWG